MQRIIVINSKGGCGKTTISTNLASLYASKGKNTALYDYDTQSSSMRWMQARGNNQEATDIHGVIAHKKSGSVTSSWHLRMPPETERVIVDTPPGLKGPDLIDQLKGTDAILIPVLPSSIDTYATADFIRDLFLGANIRTNKIRVAIIANRIKKHTLAFSALERFLNSLNIPVLAQLRDTQNYVRAAEAGLGIHELKRQPISIDKLHWASIYNWLENTDQRPTPKLIAHNSVITAAIGNSNPGFGTN